MDIPTCQTEREAFFLSKISNFTPPTSRHDQLMLGVYKNLLHSVRELRRLEQSSNRRNLPADLL